MKTFFKYIITIGIVIAIIFGIRAIVINKRQSDEVYEILTESKLNKIDNSKMQQSVSRMKNFYDTNKDSNIIPDEIKLSWESGEMFFYLTAYSNCSDYLIELKDLTALSVKQSKDYNNKINQAIDNTFKSLERQNEVASQLNNYLQSSEIGESNLKFYYNALVSAVSQTTKDYSTLVKTLSNFVLENVYNNSTSNFDFVKIYLKANMTDSTLNNFELLNDYNELFTRAENINEKFIVEFNKITNISLLLSSTNKLEFLQQNNNQTYNYLAKFLFNIDYVEVGEE